MGHQIGPDTGSFRPAGKGRQGEPSTFNRADRYDDAAVRRNRHGPLARLDPGNASALQLQAVDVAVGHHHEALAHVVSRLGPSDSGRLHQKRHAAELVEREEARKRLALHGERRLELQQVPQVL